MKKALGFLVVLWAGWLSCAPTSFAQPKDERSAVSHAVGDDRFTAGDNVRIDQPVGGDLFAAGGEVNVRAPVGGDLFAGGGKVRVTSAVGQSIFVGGGEVHLDGAVGRNVRIGGGNVTIGENAQVAGNLSAAGGRVQVLGGVKGYVLVGGGEVLIDGPVGGDVEIEAGDVALGPNARVGGKLRYSSDEEINRDPAAQIAGGVERGPAHWRRIRSEHSWNFEGGWIWASGLIALAALLVYALPNFYARVSATAHERIGASLLIGFIGLVCVPIAAVLVMITVIGIPLGLLALLAYPVLLIVGYAGSAIALGDGILRRWRGSADGSALWRAGAAALAMLAIALLARIPILGGLVVFLAVIAGAGALLMQVRRRAPAAA